MTIIDENLLQYFRRKDRCELCGMPNQLGVDPHHIKPRGMGGGSRLDVVLNLIALCRACHIRAEAGTPTQLALWHLVADREGLRNGTMVQDAIRTLLRRAK